MHVLTDRRRARRPGDGSANPFDAADPCGNIITSNDDACAPASSVEATGLVEGVVQVVVASYNNDTVGNYSLNVSSTTCT